jgi:hypothetical protein
MVSSLVRRDDASRLRVFPGGRLVCRSRGCTSERMDDVVRLVRGPPMSTPPAEVAKNLRVSIPTFYR